MIMDLTAQIPDVTVGRAACYGPRAQRANAPQYN